MGHKNIHKLRNFVSSPEENSSLIIGEWKKRITKRDIVWCLGDICFDKENLDAIGNLAGKKILVHGNHCIENSTNDLVQVFDEIYGFVRYKKMWVSHCPIHPDEIRRCVGNIHSHVHHAIVTKRNWYGRKIPDPKYLHAGVDSVYPKYGSVFLTLDQAKSHFNI